MEGKGSIRLETGISGGGINGGTGATDKEESEGESDYETGGWLV